MSRTPSITSLSSMKSEIESRKELSPDTNSPRPETERSFFGSFSSVFKRRESEPFVLDYVVGYSDSYVSFRGTYGAGDSEAKTRKRI